MSYVVRRVTIFVAPRALTTLHVQMFEYIDLMTDTLKAAIPTVPIVAKGGMMLLLGHICGMNCLLIGR